jgi:predicted DCC family thiol-disulfide oxidoreductase YuxK
MKEKPILLVDSECAFCSKSVAFIMKKGGDGKFEFLSLRSDKGKQLLIKNGLPASYTESVVMIENGQAYLKSDAALRASKHLDGLVGKLYFARFVPRKIRDAIYGFIAKHRHKL